MSGRVHRPNHEHADVTGGWLRPAVFGAADGLVSNFALIMGVAAGTAAGSSETGSGTSPVLLAGIAGLAAGAFSMAAGEYISVASQSELARAEVEVERREIHRDDAEEQAELAERLVGWGLEQQLAQHVAEQVHADPEVAVRVHAREELGIDADDLPSAPLAAISSFLSFALGALLPLLPYLVGATSPWPAVVVSLAALFACGAVVTALTSRPWWYGGTRQLLVGGVAAGVTVLIGLAFGASGL